MPSNTAGGSIQTHAASRNQRNAGLCAGGRKGRAEASRIRRGVSTTASWSAPAARSGRNALDSLRRPAHGAQSNFGRKDFDFGDRDLSFEEYATPGDRQD